MAKRINAFEFTSDGYKVSRPGVHAKTKTNNHKNSRNYKKSYRGQGR